MEHIVLRAVLQLCGKDIREEKHFHRYLAMLGYARLLTMDAVTVKVALGNEEGLKDLEEAGRFFEEKKVDIKLLKMGIQTFSSKMKINAETDCKSLLLSSLEKPEMSSYDILSQILANDEEVFQVFAQGNTMEDFFNNTEWLDKTVETQEAPAVEKEVKTNDEPGKTLQEEPKEERPTFQELAERYRKLRVDLLNVVKGQEEPVLEFVQGCYQGAVLRENGKRKLPKANFLFLGPPGVGKTLLAQTASESLGYPTKVFNMSEYSAPQSHESLIGISSFYKDAEEGTLVKFVRENPKCILVFDEIEKAHRNTIQLFLQILDLGTLDNTFTKEKTEFKDTIIIFTSNACSEIYENNFGNISRTPKNVILNALKNEVNPSTGVHTFPNAICSRIAAGNLIMFNHLSVRDMAQMVNSSFEKTVAQIQEDYGYGVSYNSRLPLLFMFHHGNAMDARIAARQSDKFIKNELFELARQLESHPDLLDDVKALRFEVDLESPELDPEIRGLFENPQITEIVIVCDPEQQHYFKLSEKYKVHFATSVEELCNCLQQDITLVLIDPMCGLKEGGTRGISLDDYDSVGVKAFACMEVEARNIPVYLFETGTTLKETDKNTFLRKGAAGVVSSIGVAEASVRKQIEEISEEIFMEKQGKEFGRKGYVLSYNTAQICENHTVKIQFHDLKKQQALDAESAAALVADVDRPTVHFEDVIGAENAKEELKYFIKYLSNPRKFVLEGGKPAKGVLLYGPPGTGKTMLARAMAGESNVSFIQISATEFLTKWYGQSEQNVRDLFKRAQKFAPAIIFIDEIDAIGKMRTGENPQTESVLNTLLTEIDGFKTDLKNPVFVLAATNYSIENGGSNRMTLDPALVRRFDNRICVDLPNEKERLRYLEIMSAKKGFVDLGGDVLKNVATRTPGLSLAILQNVIDLAFRNAKKEGRNPDGNDLQTALEEYNYGEKREWGEEYYRSVAIHESGHAYLAYLSGEKPSYMTIESRGNFGGYMAHENGEHKPNFTKEEIYWRIRCCLAGRAAEEIFFGKEASLNTGASSDLQNATQYVLSMICDYGMMEGQLIALPFKTIAGTALAADYMALANKILQEEMAVTIQLLTEGKEKVQRLAERLMKNNHLTGVEILDTLK